MQYKSTRNSGLRLNSSEVIARGISEEGGLFVPEMLPDFRTALSSLSELSYHALAETIFSAFLTDFSREEIQDCVKKAYAPEKFAGEEPVVIKPLTAHGENKYLMELWHGPTCAFKDMALQILPHFLTKSLQKAMPGKEAVILVATSGDTGKAALEGFRDVPGTRMVVFYPKDGVSPMQRLQMVTQEGENLTVCAIEGNFDDAQTGVKQIFTDSAMKQKLTEQNMFFSSANSINWGRLLPQIVYYFYAYFDLYRKGALSHLGQEINIVVPTGNFGNILAAYYASEMGLPVHRFICASNANKVLTDFISTGVYDRRREFFATNSPSMDILVSSNLERLLYALSGESDEALSGWMRQLAETGAYDVGSVVLEKLQARFFGGFCSDVETLQAIRRVKEQDSYLCDTHTAVALEVYRQYAEKTGDTATPTVVASTANPYKFVTSVLGSLEKVPEEDEFQSLARLEELSGTKAPVQITSLKNKALRFDSLCVSKPELPAFILNTLGIGGN